MTTAEMRTLHDRMQYGSCLRAGPRGTAGPRHCRNLRSAGHVTNDPILALLKDSVVHRLVLAAGAAADGMILSSRQQLLVTRARDADGAALEMERHLRGSHFMSDLAGDHPETAVIDMRWERPVANQTFAESAPEAGPREDAGTELAVRPRRPGEQAANSSDALSSCTAS